jgi:hypothetical protein
MKKYFILNHFSLFFILAVSFLIFSGCFEEYILIIKNESSYDVSFNLTTGYRTGDYVLEAGGQFTHSMNKNHSHSINDYEPKENVTLSDDGDTYTFINIIIPPFNPIPASIFNTLSKDVILDGDGAISTDPLTVEANQEIKTETIIKKDPVFTAETTDGYPVQVDYTFDETIYMIILR